MAPNYSSNSVQSPVTSHGVAHTESQKHKDKDNGCKLTNAEMWKHDQFYKTKICIPHQKQRCRRGANCCFAHDVEELRNQINLNKTRLCPKLLDGTCNDPMNCRFAHNEEELRATPDYFKTALCKYWKRGVLCEAGITCRHAHGEYELRPKKTKKPHASTSGGKGGSADGSIIKEEEEVETQGGELIREKPLSLERNEDITSLFDNKIDDAQNNNMFENETDDTIRISQKHINELQSLRNELNEARDRVSSDHSLGISSTSGVQSNTNSMPRSASARALYQQSVYPYTQAQVGYTPDMVDVMSTISTPTASITDVLNALGLTPSQYRYLKNLWDMRVSEAVQRKKQTKIAHTHGGNTHTKTNTHTSTPSHPHIQNSTHTHTTTHPNSHPHSHTKTHTHSHPNPHTYAHTHTPTHTNFSPVAVSVATAASTSCETPPNESTYWSNKSYNGKFIQSPFFTDTKTGHVSPRSHNHTKTQYSPHTCTPAGHTLTAPHTHTSTPHASHPHSHSHSHSHTHSHPHSHSHTDTSSQNSQTQTQKLCIDQFKANNLCFRIATKGYAGFDVERAVLAEINGKLTLATITPPDKPFLSTTSSVPDMLSFQRHNMSPLSAFTEAAADFEDEVVHSGTVTHTHPHTHKHTQHSNQVSNNDVSTQDLLLMANNNLSVEESGIYGDNEPSFFDMEMSLGGMKGSTSLPNLMFGWYKSFGIYEEDNDDVDIDVEIGDDVTVNEAYQNADVQHSLVCPDM